MNGVFNGSICKTLTDDVTWKTQDKLTKDVRLKTFYARHAIRLIRDARIEKVKKVNEDLIFRKVNYDVLKSSTIFD